MRYFPSLPKKRVPGLRLLLTALLATGCETTIDIPTPEETLRLAVVYTLSNQPPVRGQPGVADARTPYVSASRRLFEEGPLGRNDATVEVLDARGQVVESFTNTPTISGLVIPLGDGSYTATRNFRAQPGETYTLRASAPGLEAVESTLTLPAAARVETASFVPHTANSPNRPPAPVQGRLSITVPDNPATTDYYLVYARVLDQAGKLWGNLLPDYTTQNNDLDIDSWRVVADRFQLSKDRRTDLDASPYPYADAGRNGQPLTLNSDAFAYSQARITAGSPPPEPFYIEVTVSSITRDTYLFYQSLRRYYAAKNNVFAEPAPLVSNIRNGYGLFGGATDVTYRFKL
ncbi:DUF4249 domain-containing protein [Hymenobacter terrenus]|uniref:DUF4249 domain-containing protein n=1 Tax=Hymenobacter terrenus TaxID=1629124 RepID=UPI000619A1B1|nr:DUF4249 domain-containing protein [Hymenobacter terrenus]